MTKVRGANRRRIARLKKLYNWFKFWLTGGGDVALAEQLAACKHTALVSSFAILAAGGVI